MTAFIIRRLIQSIIVILVVSFMIFLLTNLLPGDPISIYISQTTADTYDPELLAALRHQYHLDEPIIVQYGIWLANVCRGNLGESIFLHQKVAGLIGDRLPVTFHVGVIAWLLSGIVGTALGAICALKRNTWIDNLLSVLANIGITSPNFWLGVLLIYFLALKIPWLPVHGYVSPFDDFMGSTMRLIMPVICLSVFPIASLTRQTRSSMLEVIHQDYIRTAKGKGLKPGIVLLRHTLKNGLIPTVTLWGMQTRIIVGGSVIIETIFDVPGIGRMLIDAIRSQDFQVLQGCVLVIAVVISIANLLVDISYGWLDPRVKYQ